MECDLERMFGDLAGELPTSTAGDEDFVLSAQTLPISPPQMRTSKLLISKGVHGYNGWYRADSLWCQASRHTYKHLGMLILAALFHPQASKVHVELTHPDSEIKNLVIDFEHISSDDLTPGYHTRPFALNYYPEETQRHPWPGLGLDPYDLPCFYLTSMEPETLLTEESWKGRDTVIGFGSDRGAARLAELLLNASLPQNPNVEYELEGEAGFRGVGPWSAEVRLFLPGSFGWDPEKWPADVAGLEGQA